MEKSLACLKVGESSVVSGINTQGPLHRRLLDIGLVVGTRIKCILKSPFGDPSAYLIRGAVIAIRQEDGEKIKVNSDALCSEVRCSGSHNKLGRASRSQE